MKVYLEVSKDVQIWDKNGVKLESYKKLQNILEENGFRYESRNYYSTDIKLIRKIKISKLEGSSEFDNLIDVIFDTEKMKFIPELPLFGESSTTGSSGTSGTSGSSGTNGKSGLFWSKKSKPEIKEIQITQEELDFQLLRELVSGTLNLGIPKEYFNT